MIDLNNVKQMAMITIGCGISIFPNGDVTKDEDIFTSLSHG